MKPIITTTASALIIATMAFVAPVHSGEAPAFIQETFPEQGVTSAWESYESVFLHPDAALDVKTKELIALAVAAQVPCDYCVYYHNRAARAQGASDAEVKEALAAAALVRKWSTMLNGSQYSDEQWRREVDAMFADE
ncbi:Alkylhydroperoxidase AhpD core [Thioalkalivibrio nitratireducens DSM 14787]|uniref:Alkylhydroperoxidase AhpD core n=1 Tax=Thioalkalivibrio nitratireducens (strain DSM 14787 / UNIQEM 213 / ALEN2) TaxID=1255043 RepID=L0E0F1_THIND|nr:carboxymuconolactone decarboxylase family protein [Thioalkalivibrio nitratireducens]AGA34690.1 Alkylhydroperoxidase AhpD core [Thioalkalivibrio nitratireducens DSM 14787]